MARSLPVAAAGPMPRLAGLSIVLPCHDEEGNVEQAIDEAAAAARRVADAHEILVVDDGSRDATRELALARAAADPRVRVLVHEHNRGYGAALRTGFAAARLEWIFLTDADLQFDLGDLDRTLPLADGRDLVVGYRMRRADPPHRRLNAAAWNALVHRAFGLPVRDVDCAFKLMRRELVQSLALGADGAMVSTELLVRAQAAGAVITELGVMHRPRTAGRSSGANPAVVLRAFRELRVLRARIRDEAVPAVPAAPAARAA
jgi:glycosyltransferase involved in cell wall biosynthesis